jgi:protein ImuB
VGETSKSQNVRRDGGIEKETSKRQNVKKSKVEPDRHYDILSHETPQGAAKEAWDRTFDTVAARPGERPMVLWHRPRAVRAMALSPDGAPTWFCYRGRDCQVAHAAGPERLETGWWRGPDTRRDYFRVVTRDGQRFWMFKDLESRQWFVHGSYG